MAPLARRVERLRGQSGEMGGFAGGSLEHLRQRPGAQWAGLFLGVPSCPEEAREPSWETAKGGTLIMLERVHEPGAAGPWQLEDRDAPPRVAPVLVVHTLRQV
eukprot:scaffold26142_cov54-Phaeocystis_antarctica.AAC.1